MYYLPFSLCMESTSYVLSFRILFFYLVTTGWILMSACVRIQSIKYIHSATTASIIYLTDIGLSPSLSYRWLHSLHLESASSGPVVLKVVPEAGAAFSGIIVDHFLCASLFPHPPSVCSIYVWSIDQPGKVADRARGQLNTRNEHFPVPVRA